MSRKEANNTFTEGLINDLNPVNSPSTILTDCLNGTIITYDGNEYNLQNDKGNIALKNCKLKPNYIPVGVKEYGDIIYIVSYNPINEHVEIGSYPSPQTIFTSEDSNDNKKTITSLINENSNNKFSEIKIKDTLQVFYKTNTGIDLKLNPGDQYKITKVGTGSNEYEYLEYYILGEDQKEYDISDEIQIDSSGYVNVSWQTPGWLSYKQKIANIDNFTINTKKYKIEKSGNDFKSLTLTLNFEIASSDKVFINNVKTSIDSNNSELWVDLKIKKNNNNYELLDTQFQIKKYIDTSNGNIVFYGNYTFDGSDNININDTLAIEAIPYIHINDTTKLYYDNKKFENSYIVNSISSIDLVTLDNIWKYSVNERELHLTFNSKSKNDSAFEHDLFMYYKLSRIGPGNTLYDVELYDTYKQIPNWNYNGITNLNLNFTNFNEDTYKTQIATPDNPYPFYKEDIYVMTLGISASPKLDGKDPEKLFHRIIVASELMNGFSVDDYTTIERDDWISRYQDYVRTDNVIVTPAATPNNDDPTLEFSEDYQNWLNGVEWNPKYSDWKKYTTFSTPLYTAAMITASQKYSFNLKLNSNEQVLKGPLWISLLENSKIKANISGQELVRNNILEKKEINYKNDINVSAKYIYNIEPLLQNPRNIWSYTDKAVNSKQATLGFYALVPWNGKEGVNNPVYRNMYSIFDYYITNDKGFPEHIQKKVAHNKFDQEIIEPEYQDLINLIDNINCDFLIITLYIEITGHDSLRKEDYGKIIHYSNDNIGTKIFEVTKNSKYYIQKQFYACKLRTGNLTFIQLPDNVNHAQLSEGIFHIICHNDDAHYGSFYNLKKSGTANPYIHNYSVATDFIFSDKCEWNGYDLFKKFQYENSDLNDCNFNNLTSTTDIVLGQKELFSKDYKYPIKFEGSAIDKRISEEDQKINARNDKSITDKNKFVKDKIFMAYQQNSERYYYKEDFLGQQYTMLLNALNKEFMNDNSLWAEMHLQYFKTSNNTEDLMRYRLGEYAGELLG